MINLMYLHWGFVEATMITVDCNVNKGRIGTKPARGFVCNEFGQDFPVIAEYEYISPPITRDLN